MTTIQPLWTMILVLGLGTYALRASFIMYFGTRAVPPLAERVLRLVPAAVLAALVAPAVFSVQAGPDPLRLAAGAVAALVAWRTRSVGWTVLAGMGVLWILHALVPSFRL